MSSALQRLIRAAKVIEKLAWKYEQQDVAAALMKHGSHRDREAVGFVGQYLLDVWEVNREEERKMEPRCCECGENVFERKDRTARTDARYCSPPCRQRAYRKRVTARGSGGDWRRNEATVCDG